VRSASEGDRSLDARVERERAHGRRILASEEANWGWNTPAGQVRRARRFELMAASGPAPNDRLRVLEIGCGSGTFTGSLHQAFPRLTAIDVSEPLLEAARTRHPGVTFLQVDAHRTTFPDGSFDLVVGCSVLHHLDWGRALREIHRVLAPGGHIRFSEPNLINPQIYLQKNWSWLKERMGDSPDEYAFSRWTILRDLRAAGFAEAAAEPYEFLHPEVPERWISAVIRLEGWLERTPLRHIAGSLKITATKNR
jgi:ubiquinone/menaquinone biosynthesis C-methylase UbiE